MRRLSISAMAGLLVLLLVLSGCSLLDKEPDAMGLSVNEEGILIRDGKPYHGVGLNFFSLFNRTMDDPEDKSYAEGLKEIGSFGIPFVRFAASPYWPVSFKMYFDDREKYYQLMDDVVKAAEEAGVGLIPSFIWAETSWPDLMKEPRNAWGDVNSKTMDMMRTYVTEVVTRYKDSPAIWGWELGNEFNLQVDLPNAKDARPPVVPELGTPTERSEKDDVTSETMATLQAEFAKTVQGIDSSRIILTGNALPRPSAWHQREQNSWGQDTKENFKTILKDQNPLPYSMLTVHYYPGEARFGAPDDPKVLVPLMMEASAEAKQPLFIGEIGVSGPEETGRPVFESYMNEIEKAQVPLTAVWVYDLPNQPENTILGSNERRYQLEMLQEMNKRMSKLK
ncbi:cellulase family glycosylhydrolase [Paenibacillus mendelii]|uniref:Cellulase family glycosylhydrolase n=1 Tax=Paenibacillus mendelii TaxID=206163 RepID=A0ABV6J5C2_9BACL|nr:cellulase family glycosylhydrolase [Paenibacillus mendelii]MCQ6560219.1 glycoside hydrolase family 5 protein [Paenibacillus mendelii]